jgi:carbonic anhydrase
LTPRRKRLGLDETAAWSGRRHEFLGGRLQSVFGRSAENLSNTWARNGKEKGACGEEVGKKLTISCESTTLLALISLQSWSCKPEKEAPPFEVQSDWKEGRPIDIRGARKAELPALKFDYDSVPLNIIDNGHTIQVNYPAGSTLTVGKKLYMLKQFHFHHPSEEHVNGHDYDMVVHLVHADAEGHLAVVAVFLEEGNANPFIDLLWQNLPTEKGKAVDVSGVTLNAKALLPSDHGYYMFSGSLTTPPCSEGMTWYVVKKPLALSKDQVAAFAKLYPRNARPIQAANGREILETE